MKVKDVKHKVTLDDFEHRLIVGCVKVARTRINTAVNDLYGGWDDFSEDSKPFIEDALKTADLEAVYTSVKNDENESKDILVGFEKEYPTVAKESNIEDILKSLKEKQKK